MLSKKYPQSFKKQHNSRRMAPPRIPRVYPYTSIQEAPHSHHVLGLFINQRLLLPKRYIAYIRKLVRKFFKKRKIRCWFRVQLNRTVSSKSKNSRMGKGVGTINRAGYLLQPTTPLLVVANISKARLECLSLLLRARIGATFRIEIL